MITSKKKCKTHKSQNAQSLLDALLSFTPCFITGQMVGNHLVICWWLCIGICIGCDYGFNSTRCLLFGYIFGL